MKNFWKNKTLPATSADEKLKKISDLLFPPLQLNEEMDKTGTTHKYHIDYSVDSNLDAVLMDLQEGRNDAIVQATLNKSITRLNEARRILGAYALLNPDAKYIIVDDGENLDVESKED